MATVPVTSLPCLASTSARFGSWRAQLGAPQGIITKVPTADLESLDPSKSDEDALGLSYDQIDDFLEGKKIDAAAEQRIIHIFLTTAHKRQPIATVYDQ